MSEYVDDTVGEGLPHHPSFLQGVSDLDRMKMRADLPEVSVEHGATFSTSAVLRLSANLNDSDTLLVRATAATPERAERLRQAVAYAAGVLRAAIAAINESSQPQGQLPRRPVEDVVAPELLGADIQQDHRSEDDNMAAQHASLDRIPTSN